MTPTKHETRRRELVGRIADALLADGVAALPLRDLAARVGVSDRMLLYYFEDKAALVEASIAELAVRLDKVLSEAREPGRHPPAKVMRDTADFMALPGVAPFRAVWADILARGGRDEAPFGDIARRLVEGAVGDIEARLTIADVKSRRRMAGAILAAIEGVWLVGMVAPGTTEDAVEILARRLTA
jgi:AcrR family transcriptional regulator